MNLFCGMPQGMVTPKSILDSNLTVCIMVAKLLCCASLLKCDDVRMKELDGAKGAILLRKKAQSMASCNALLMPHREKKCL